MDKDITAKIKMLLALSGKSQKELAAFLGIQYQSLQNKLQRGSFSAADLSKIATFAGADLYFEKDQNKIKLNIDQ